MPSPIWSRPRPPRVGFGAFTAVYGLAWLAGGTILGALYGYSIHDLIIFTVLTQALALLLFLPLLRAPFGHSQR
ncbi:MAG: hypothetical protein ACRDST_23170 [Pseudonocardiaceae bacterium]